MNGSFVSLSVKYVVLSYLPVASTFSTWIFPSDMVEKKQSPTPRRVLFL